jgi:hypothetical protein
MASATNKHPYEIEVTETTVKKYLVTAQDEDEAIDLFDLTKGSIMDYEMISFDITNVTLLD